MKFILFVSYDIIKKEIIMKISAVIPLYNAEKYIYKCIKSVIDQTYDDWELIVVDDGSDDNSVDIVTHIALNEKRIKLYCQKNEGPGSARNLGIKYAQGEIVVFIDSDDYVACDYFMQLSKMMIKHDLVFINVAQVSTNGYTIKNENMYQYKNLDKDTLLRCQMTGKIPWGGVRKAARRSLITSNNIFFDNLLVGEECLYSFKVLNSANNYGFMSKKNNYFYVNHTNSQSKLENIDPYYDVVFSLKTYLYENGYYKKFADTLNSLIIVAMLVSMDRIARIYNGSVRKEKCSQIFNQYSKIIDRKYSIDIHNIPTRALICLPFINAHNYTAIIILSKLKTWFEERKMAYK